MSINVIGCFPYGSIGFVFDASSPGICPRGGTDVAEEFSFAVVAIMARGYAVAMCPTVAIWIEACYPCRHVKWSSSRCWGRRRHGVRAGCSVGSWRSVEFFYQRCVCCQDILQLFTQIVVGCGELRIGLGELVDNVANINYCHVQVVQGLSDVDGRVGAVKVILRRIHLVLFLSIVVFCGKQMFEMHPFLLFSGFRRHSLHASL